MSAATASLPRATPERAAELRESLAAIRNRVKQAASPNTTPTLVAVSKIKPASDVLACYEAGQLDFGENYVQEMVEKANQLPIDIRWHFIGTLQSNKAKILAAIPNLYAIQTLTSIKTATAINTAIDKNVVLPERTSPLNVLLQVNTSGEDNKSGLDPLLPSSTTTAESEDASDASELAQLACHVISNCPRLHLQGLMTIGSLTESLASSSSSEKPNQDFETLISTRAALQDYLEKAGFPAREGKWGVDGKLLVSMGMSSDFEAALKVGSDVVRVGTGIFGARPKRE